MVQKSKWFDLITFVLFSTSYVDPFDDLLGLLELGVPVHMMTGPPRTVSRTPA